MVSTRVDLHHPLCYSAACMPKGKEQDQGEPGVWNFRDVPREVIVKAKIEAAVQNKSVKALLIDLVEAHWQELEKKGVLPRGKS